jgi:hypothetical protein
LYDLLSIPLITACAKHNIKINHIIRIRAGMILKTCDDIIHTPHVDYPYPHSTMLFYLNDSDGDTLFYNEMHSGEQSQIAALEKSKVTISERIEPKANRYSIFNGLQFHSSTAPKKSEFRIVINYNFV